MKADLVVSDTSPIRALAHLGLMGLLPRLFARILVPPAVSAELRTPGAHFPALNVADYPFIREQPLSDLSAAVRFQTTLHAGESQAIALALEVGTRYLLIDEARGRAVASEAGLIPIGALSLLVEAKRIGVTPAVGPLIDRLKNEIDFRVSARVQAEILRLAGEA